MLKIMMINSVLRAIQIMFIMTIFPRRLLKLGINQYTRKVQKRQMRLKVQMLEYRMLLLA